MEQKDSLLGVLETLFKWRRPVLIICAVAAFGTAGISLLLPNYYRATTIFLAASPDQAMPELFFDRSGSQRSYLYGSENDIDRVLTIAQSQELVSFLVDSFQLYEHYDISPEHPKAPHFVQRRFFSLYDIEKTKRDAIELSVEDKDPAFAAQVANAAREKINDIGKRLLKESLLKKIQTYDQEVYDKSVRVQKLGDTLATLRREYNIYNTISQTESLSAQISQTEGKLIRDSVRLENLTGKAPRDTIMYLSARVSGTREELKKLEGRMDKINAGIPIVQIFEKQYAEVNQRLGEDNERLKYFRATYESDVPTVLLVEEASAPIVKSRPKRSMIVIGATAVAFLFSVIGVLLLDTYRDVDWKRIIQAKK